MSRCRLCPRWSRNIHIPILIVRVIRNATDVTEVREPVLVLQFFMMRKGVNKHESHVLIVVADNDRIHRAEILHTIRSPVSAWPCQKNCPLCILDVRNLTNCAAIDDAVWLRKEITHGSSGQAKRHAIFNSLLVLLPFPSIVATDNTNPAVLAHCAICDIHQRVEPNELLISHGMLGNLL